MITIGSLFDGISGFPLAGERSGMTTLWGSEIEPLCCPEYVLEGIKEVIEREGEE